MRDLFLTNVQRLASQDINWWIGLEWCGLLWCFYQLFGLSFWRHPFTAEHPLVSKWCNATFLQIWWRNKLIYILRMSTFSDHLCFWLNYSFKTVSQPGQAGASGLTADISQNPFKTSKTVQLVKIRSHKGLLVCSEHQESLNAVHLQQLMISWELTLAFCSVSSEAARSSTSSLRLCFSFSSLALVLCRLSHCSPSSDRASLWRFLSPAATASACTDDSSSSRRRRCSSSSRFLFISIYTHNMTHNRAIACFTLSFKSLRSVRLRNE